MTIEIEKTGNVRTDLGAMIGTAMIIGSAIGLQSNLMVQHQRTLADEVRAGGTKMAQLGDDQVIGDTLMTAVTLMTGLMMIPDGKMVNSRVTSMLLENPMARDVSMGRDATIPMGATMLRAEGMKLLVVSGNEVMSVRVEVMHLEVKADEMERLVHLKRSVDVVRSAHLQMIPQQGRTMEVDGNVRKEKVTEHGPTQAKTA